MYKISQEFHNQEWLSNFMRRFKFTPLRAAIAMALLNLIIDLPLAVRFNVLFPGSQSKGLLGEPSDWLYEFLVHPIVLAYFCWLQTSGIKLIEQLTSEKFPDNQKSIQTILTTWSGRMQSKWFVWAAALGSLTFVIWFVLAFTPSLAISPYAASPYSSWVTAHPLITLIRAPVIFLVVYALIFVVIDLVIIARVLNILMGKCNVEIEPFHPDGAGGLGFIGRFTANLSYLIGVLGILLFSRILQDPQNLYDERSFVLLLGIVLYLVLAPIFFFLPLRMTHVAMVNFRDNLLSEIAYKIEFAMQELGIFPQLNGESRSENHLDLDAGHIKELTEKIEHFNGLRDFVKSNVPIWPFNTGSLRKFYGIIMAPLVPTLLAIVRDLIFG